MHSTCSVLGSSQAIPLQVHGKIVCHETTPWCQNGWGLLVYMTGGSVFSLSPSLLSACPPRLTVFDNWGCIVNTPWWGHDGGAGRVVGRVVMVMILVMVLVLVVV